MTERDMRSEGRPYRDLIGVMLVGPDGLPYSATGGGGGSATWGAIGGTLSAQTDLQNALNLKADASALSGYVPTTRTVNGHALSANVTVTASDVGAPSGSGTSSGSNTGDQTITLTGDVTGSGTGSFAATIAAGSVTLAKMANLAANSFLGNNTGSPATPIALTAAQATAALNLFSTSLQGLVPASGGGMMNFLRADGTWAAAGGGSTGQEFERFQTYGLVGPVDQKVARSGVTISQVQVNVPFLPQGAQSLTTTGTTDFAIGDAAARTKIAMTFTSLSAAYTFLTSALRVKKSGSPTDNLSANVYATSANLPTGASIATVSYTCPGAALSTSYQSVAWRYAGYADAASTVYAVVIERSGAVDASNYYLVEGIATGGAAGAQHCVYNGSTWSANGTNQLRYAINGADVYDLLKRADDTVKTASDSIFTNTFGFAVTALDASFLTTVTAGFTGTVSANDRLQLFQFASATASASGSYVSLKN